MVSQAKPDYVFKIILLAEWGVGIFEFLTQLTLGRTKFINRYIDNKYEEKHRSTIGADFVEHF